MNHLTFKEKNGMYSWVKDERRWWKDVLAVASIAVFTYLALIAIGD